MNNEMTLQDTIELMNSEDYKDRFKAEYYQAEIRRNKLHDMLVKYKAGALSFEPNCSYELLYKQEIHMSEYIEDLQVRAIIEKIDI